MAIRARPISKPAGMLREAGRMFSVGLEALHTVFRRPWPFQEFLEQMWFLIKVTTVPVILISIPFGMVISLHVGSFVRQLGAQAHMGAAMVLAVLLDAIVSVAGIAGGWFFAVVVQHGTTSSYFASFNELSQMPDLFMALLKAAVFGYVGGTVACYKGFYAKGGPKGVGDAVNQAVVITFLLLFFLNFILTAVYFNFVPQKF